MFKNMIIDLLDILGIVKSKYDPIFSKIGDYATNKAITDVVKDNQKKVEKSINDLMSKPGDEIESIGIKTTYAGNESLRLGIQSIVKEMIEKIENIPTNYIDRIQKEVLENVDKNGIGSLFETINKNIKEITDSEDNLIKLGTKDLVNYANQSLTRQQYLQAGIDQFEWNHSSASETPRPLHVQYDGKIFSLHDLPVIDLKTGERGIPGQLYNCRCFMTPVIEL